MLLDPEMELMRIWACISAFGTSDGKQIYDCHSAMSVVTFRTVSANWWFTLVSAKLVVAAEAIFVMHNGSSSVLVVSKSF